MVRATFNESGLPNGTNWSVEVNGTYQNAQAPVIRILFGEPNGTYTYSVYGNGTYEASEPSGAVVVAGANVTVTIGFSLIPTFSVTFLETGLPSGTWWSMNLTDHYNRTTSSSIVFTVQNGSDWWVVRPSLVGTCRLPSESRRWHRDGERVAARIQHQLRPRSTV